MANVPITLAGGGAADLDQITATASDILAPKKSVNGDGDVITGTITSLGANTWTPGTSAQTLAAGQYLSGTQTISAVSQTNLSAANIKKGTTITIKGGNNTIYSVTGTWEGYIVGSADFYNRGSWGANSRTFFSGSAGTAILIPGAHPATSYTSYYLDIGIGKKNAYGYTKLVVEGSGLTGGTIQINYKSTMPTSITDGTSGATRDSVTTTKQIYSLTNAAINAGDVYWAIRQNTTDGKGYITRIYFA